MVKAKAKAEHAAARAAAAGANASLTGVQSAASSRAQTPTGGPPTPGDDDMPASVGLITDAPDIIPPVHLPNGNVASGTTIDRTQLLHQHPVEINLFISLIVPILIDVYAASVSLPVRTKSLTSLLKAVSFQDEEQLRSTLQVCYVVSMNESAWT